MKQSSLPHREDDLERITVELLAGRRLTGRLVDLDVYGARVRFPPGSSGLWLAQLIDLRFAGDVLPRTLQVQARVRSRRENDAGPEYEFLFVDREPIRRELLPALMDGSDRRGARRVRPPKPVQVRLAALNGLVLLKGTLVDLSESGIALLVSPDDERRFADIVQARASFTLPISPAQQVEFAVTIRERRLQNAAVLFACALVVETENGFEDQRDIVRQYVARL